MRGPGQKNDVIVISKVKKQNKIVKVLATN